MLLLHTNALRAAPIVSLMVASLAFSGVARAQDPVATLNYTSTGFSPAVVKVPSGQRIPIAVRNQTDRPMEFESHDLNREKLVPGSSVVRLWIGPLDAGRYQFFDDFRPALSGTIVVGASDSANTPVK